MAANLAQDGVSLKLFAERFQQQTQDASALMQALAQRLQSPEGKASLQRLQQHQAKADAVVATLHAERRAGGDVGLVVRQALMPAV